MQTTSGLIPLTFRRSLTRFDRARRVWIAGRTNVVSAPRSFERIESLPHWLAATLTCGLHFPARGVLHTLLALAIALQGLFFYALARVWNFPRRSAIAACWLAPLVVSATPLGHELGSYLFEGYGLYTQALALGPFLIALGLSGKISGWVPEAEEASIRSGLELGLSLAITFLFHEFYGVMAVLVCITFAAFGVLARWVRPVPLAKTMLCAAVLFAVVTSHQWLSIFQDKELMHHSAWHLTQRWDGVGARAAALLLFGGRLLDFGGLPVLSLLALLGSILALGKNARRVQRAPLLLLALGFVLYGGRSSFGSLLQWLPGLESVHLERFVALIHIAGILLAANGLGSLLRWPRAERRASRIIHLVIISIGLIGVEGRVLERLNYLRRDANLILRQKEANAGFDARLFSSVAPESSRGAVWAGSPRDENKPMLGAVPYYAVAEQEGYTQASVSTHSMTYGSDTLYLFDWKNPTHYSVFNIKTVLLRASTEVPSFLVPAYSNGEVESFRAPGEGFFGVIGIPYREIVKDEKEYLEAVRLWLDGSKLDSTEYPSIVPEKVAKRWPESVATPSPIPPGDWGHVVRSYRRQSGDYEATLVADRVGAYGLIRTAYHPRWEITVNAKRVAPRWVAPGYFAFSLTPGKNEVRAHFPEDPLRAFLFRLGLFGLFAALVVLYIIPARQTVYYRGLEWVGRKSEIV